MPQDVDDASFAPDAASFRSVLDPFCTATDSDYQQVLETVGRWDLVRDRGRGSLSAAMDPSTLSRGQKQLFGLARAILRRRQRVRSGHRGGILLLDEPDLSLDASTDGPIWGIIESEFAELAILAHHLDGLG